MREFEFFFEKFNSLNPRNYLFIYMALVTPVFLMACGTSTDGGIGGNPDLDQVWIEEMNFEPSVREVPVGTELTWVNLSNVNHTVTSGSGGEHDEIFDSGTLTPGAEFSYTFNEEGTFEYYCSMHEDQGMTGAIIVGNAGTEEE